MVHSNTAKKETLQCYKIRIRMRNTISKITVKDCTLNEMIDGEKETNIKAPNIEKAQTQKRVRVRSYLVQMGVMAKV
jgi:hypothetical protein